MSVERCISTAYFAEIITINVACPTNPMYGLHSDPTGERRWHTALAAISSACALLAAGYSYSGATDSRIYLGHGRCSIDGRAFLGNVHECVVAIDRRGGDRRYQLSGKCREWYWAILDRPDANGLGWLPNGPLERGRDTSCGRDCNCCCARFNWATKTMRTQEQSLGTNGLRIS
jgi:hypothetical protein